MRKEQAMKDFNRFYLWGVNTKYSMGLYFSAALNQGPHRFQSQN
mgnify:CR=1 FL=1